MYDKIVATGQDPCVSTSRKYPPQSIRICFECFNPNLQNFGLSYKSTGTSEKFRCNPTSYDESDGTVTSPALRKPKKHKRDDAHNITWSGLCGEFAHTPLILESSSGVIGNRGVQVPFDLAWRALMPFRTCSKCAIAFMFGFG